MFTLSVGAGELIVRAVLVYVFLFVLLRILGKRHVGELAAFDHSDEKLRVTLEKPLRAGEEIEIAIGYSAHPRRGLYFVGPDDAYPKKPVEAWTQGEDEDSRYWFPCYD